MKIHTNNSFNLLSNVPCHIEAVALDKIRGFRDFHAEVKHRTPVDCLVTPHLPVLIAINDDEYDVCQPESCWNPELRANKPTYILAIIVDASVTPEIREQVMEYMHFFMGCRSGLNAKDFVTRYYASESLQQTMQLQHCLPKERMTPELLDKLIGEKRTSPSSIKRIKNQVGMTKSPSYKVRWNTYAQKHNRPRVNELFSRLNKIDARYGPHFIERLKDDNTDLDKLWHDLQGVLDREHA